MWGIEQETIKVSLKHMHYILWSMNCVSISLSLGGVEYGDANSPYHISVSNNHKKLGKLTLKSDDLKVKITKRSRQCVHYFPNGNTVSSISHTNKITQLNLSRRWFICPSQMAIDAATNISVACNRVQGLPKGIRGQRLALPEGGLLEMAAHQKVHRRSIML